MPALTILVAMWASFVFGMSGQTILHENEKRPQVVYRVSVDPNSGQTKSVCMEVSN